MIHDSLQMKPNQPALNFWAKHHISIATMSDPLNGCILCGKKRINVVIDTLFSTTNYIFAAACISTVLDVNSPLNANRQSNLIMGSSSKR